MHGLGSVYEIQIIRVINDPDHDKGVALQPETHWYSREFKVPSDATTGSYDVALGLHGGQIGYSVPWFYGSILAGKMIKLK